MFSPSAVSITDVSHTETSVCVLKLCLSWDSSRPFLFLRVQKLSSHVGLLNAWELKAHSYEIVLRNCINWLS